MGFHGSVLIFSLPIPKLVNYRKEYIFSIRMQILYFLGYIHCCELYIAETTGAKLNYSHTL